MGSGVNDTETDDRDEEGGVAGLTCEAQAEFAADVHSPQEARSFVDEHLRTWGLEGVTDTVEVLVSELVTNAVIHAATPALGRVVLSGELVRVEVADRNPAPVRMQTYHPGATSGRGLMIVDAMADDWGVEARSGGKTVWFEVTADR